MRYLRALARATALSLVVAAAGCGGPARFVSANPPPDTAADAWFRSGIPAVRAALARAVTEAARYMAQKATVEEGAPVIVRLLTQIAARFNTVVAEKIVAQGVPVIGALGGATVNMLFVDHFQEMARGHFVVRRLERCYGEAEVKKAYGDILSS